MKVMWMRTLVPAMLPISMDQSMGDASRVLPEDSGLKGVM